MVVGSNPTRAQRLFLFLRVGHFLSRAVAQKVLFGMFIQHFDFTYTQTMKHRHNHDSDSTAQCTCTLIQSDYF